MGQGQDYNKVGAIERRDGLKILINSRGQIRTGILFRKSITKYTSCSSHWNLRRGNSLLLESRVVK